MIKHCKSKRTDDDSTIKSTSVHDYVAKLIHKLNSASMKTKETKSEDKTLPYTDIKECQPCPPEKICKVCPPEKKCPPVTNKNQLVAHHLTILLFIIVIMILLIVVLLEPLNS